MTLPNGDQPLEIRDATGAIVGFILPEKRLRELLSERDQARKAVIEFEKMWEAWNLYGVIPPRECELERARDSGIEGRGLIAEIEKILYPSST